jgi:hypothetical protein
MVPGLFVRHMKENRKQELRHKQATWFQGDMLIAATLLALVCCMRNIQLFDGTGVQVRQCEAGHPACACRP